MCPLWCVCLFVCVTFLLLYFDFVVGRTLRQDRSLLFSSFYVGLPRSTLLNSTQFSSAVLLCRSHNCRSPLVRSSINGLVPHLCLSPSYTPLLYLCSSPEPSRHRLLHQYLFDTYRLVRPSPSKASTTVVFRVAEILHHPIATRAKGLEDYLSTASSFYPTPRHGLSLRYLKKKVTLFEASIAPIKTVIT